MIAPALSISTALTICTQVVASMPPNADVDDHGNADKDHRPVVGDAGEQTHQHAGAGHLRHQIGEIDDHGAGDRGEQRGARLHAARV